MDWEYVDGPKDSENKSKRVKLDAHEGANKRIKLLHAHRPEGPNRNSAASLDRGRRCLTPIYGEIQINSDQKFYRAQRRNYYVWDLVRKSL
jgi:hypothetical protein